MISTAQKILNLYQGQHGHSMFVYCSDKTIDGVLKELKNLLKKEKLAYCLETINKRDVNFVEIVKAVSKCVKTSKIDAAKISKNISITDMEARLVLEEIVKSINREKKDVFHITVLKDIKGSSATLFWSRWFFRFIIGSDPEWLLITSSEFLADYMAVESPDRKKRRVANGVYGFPLYRLSMPAFMRRNSGSYIFDLSQEPMIDTAEIYPLAKIEHDHEGQTHQTIFDAEYYIDTNLQKIFCFSDKAHTLRKEVLVTLDPGNILKMKNTKKTNFEKLYEILPEMKSVARGVKKLYGGQEASRFKQNLENLMVTGDIDISHVKLVKGKKKYTKNTPQIFTVRESIVKMTIEEIDREFILLP
jgi:hypothetical protein